jgi:hypothetical protein
MCCAWRGRCSILVFDFWLRYKSPNGLEVDSLDLLRADPIRSDPGTEQRGSSSLVGSR